MNMNETLEKQLRFLRLNSLSKDWDTILEEAKKKQLSYHRFLTDILENEYHTKKEKSRQARLNRANIPEMLVMETFPFSKQLVLKKRLVMELYDSMKYVTHPQDLIFIGPTGCGKTGLATSFLIHAINQGYRGYFIDFKDLAARLYESVADHTEKKIIGQFRSYDLLLIDEMGYVSVEKEQAGLFFDLMRKRNKQHTTLITTQLGFDEWGIFLKNTHLTSALLDRITTNCTVFNLKDCVSIRTKNIIYATKHNIAEKKTQR